MSENPYEPPQEYEPVPSPVVFATGPALHRAAIICLLVAIAMFYRVAYEPRFDGAFGGVGMLCGFFAAVLVFFAPRRPWSLAVGVSGVLIAMLIPGFLRA